MFLQQHHIAYTQDGNNHKSRRNRKMIKSSFTLPMEATIIDKAKSRAGTQNNSRDESPNPSNR